MCLSAMPLCMIVFVFLFLLYRQYISYRLLLSFKIFIFWTRDDTLLVPAIRAEDELAIKCWSGVRITYHRTFHIKGRIINQLRSSILLSETELLKESTNSESRLHFDSAFTYVGQNPSPRLNTHFPLIQQPTWSCDFSKTNSQSQLLASTIGFHCWF